MPSLPSPWLKRNQRTTIVTGMDLFSLKPRTKIDSFPDEVQHQYAFRYPTLNAKTLSSITSASREVHNAMILR